MALFERLRVSEVRSRKAFLDRLQALDQIRAQIYLSGTYARDFLLAPDVDAAKAQARHLASLQKETRVALDAYARQLEGEERDPFVALRAQIDSYWKVLDGTVRWTPEQRNRLRLAFFYDELIPRRTTMLQIADRITVANERGLMRSEAGVAAGADTLRRSLLLTYGVTLLGGAVLATLTILFTVRLQRELERRQADLQELSILLMRAQENERRTLARELHDEVGQSLSAILMEADGAESVALAGEAKTHVAAIKALTQKTVNQVRDLALLLRPSMLDDLGLAPALDWYARETTKRTGRLVAVSAEGLIDTLPDEHRTCIFRVVQEGVHNAVRHGNPNRVDVAVRRNGGRVQILVRDDGAGFDARAMRGLGLLGMEERVRRLGGALAIHSEPGRGATLEATLPVANAEGETGDASHSYSAGG